MLSSFFDSGPRRKRTRGDHDRSPFASSYARGATPPRNARQQYNRRRSLRYEDESESRSSSSASSHHEERAQQEDTEDENEEIAPLLPIFDSTHLDTLPIYTLTHTIRLLVSSRCETVLTWDQLRSPQVSQFLLKPIQHEIRTNHFSAATIYCLMANCLQFNKEISLFPANSGTIQTRAMVCELLAVKILREYTTRGLIDALSYDFDPLQGQADINPVPVANRRPGWQNAARKPLPRSARISCLEIAIRAQAKRFLAHPVVVQQLEAIWDGSIVFHAAADNMHRRRDTFQPLNYGATGARLQPGPTSAKGNSNVGTRKVVTLYNPRDASLFKLSRLRVPRYRNMLSTISFAILLGLFVAVLNQRSLHITALEVFFWIWAGGFMIDEIVGFAEQGFGLYLASFWNTMDLGILLILFVHLCLRIYGVMMPDASKRRVANTAFDLLAADAILLFPRLFSVLDHYRYFSQLIVAFRLMAADLVAVFVMITIACSGFFVALTLSFGYDGTDDASAVAYALYQMIMGFTPAVWDRWDNYTYLGRGILVIFQIICHFLIITILITVLTNSFTEVVKNANEEHQFIFAVNTISAVKSDSLFSYVPPLNVLQWMLSPLQYVMSFKQYIKTNRTVIKVTHFPILLIIYLYERMILRPAVVDAIDVVQTHQHSRSVFRPRLPRLIREASMGNLRQDQALEEVFRQPFDATLRTEILNNKRKSSTVVNKWMRDMGEDDASPPQEDDPKTVDRLERRRLGERSLSVFSRARMSSQRAPSVASDPVDLASHPEFFSPRLRLVSVASQTPSHADVNMEDEADGDDEMMTNDNDDDRLTIDTRGTKPTRPRPAPDYFSHRQSPLSRTPRRGGSTQSSIRGIRDSRGGAALSRGLSETLMQSRPEPHSRNFSFATMVFNPATEGAVGGVVRSPIDDTVDENTRPPTAIHSRPITPGSKQPSSGSGKRTPRVKHPPRTRPLFPGKENPAFKSAPNIRDMLHAPPPMPNPRRSSVEMDLVSDIGDNKAIGGGFVGALPASIANQLAFASGGLKKIQEERKEEQERLARLMMARMNTLEEGFREVVHEVRESRKAGSKNRSPDRPTQARKERRVIAKDPKGKERFGSPGKEGDSTGSSTLLDPRLSGLSVSTVVPDSPHLEPEGKGESAASVLVEPSKEQRIEKDTGDVPYVQENKKVE